MLRVHVLPTWQDIPLRDIVTWYQFRHIHSSLLNDLNVPVKIAQEQLGHASIATTLNIYTHAVEASHRKAVEAVEARLFVDSEFEAWRKRFTRRFGLPPEALFERTVSPPPRYALRWAPFARVMSEEWLASRSAFTCPGKVRLRLDHARRLEAPPGFEPGMEVLQI